MATKRLRQYSLSLLSVSLLSLLSLSFTQPVLDSDGHRLQPNTKYYILPAAAGGSGGGLALSIRDRRDPCPPTVMQESDPDSVGLAVELFPAEAGQPAKISLSADVNVAFAAATTCVQRTVWRVWGPDAATGRRYVRTGGEVGRPGKGTAEDWFRVEEYGSAPGGGYYKLVHCPAACGGGGGCGVECGEVGVVEKSGRRWVAVGGRRPLVIVFKKVS